LLLSAWARIFCCFPGSTRHKEERMA
jgi:hypothetical protein